MWCGLRLSRVEEVASAIAARLDQRDSMTLLTRASLANRLIAGLVTLGVAVFGIIAMTSLKQELMPPMSMPMAFVSAQSPGVSPDDMAETVTEPLEQALESVSGVTGVTSNTSAGSADITAEWPFEADADETLQAIRAATDSVRSTLPTGTEVEVFSGSTDETPAMMLSAGSTDDAQHFADALAGTVVPALQAIPGVQRVELAGREEQRVVIDLRADDIEKLRVDTAAIAPALESRGAALPAGQADSDEGPVAVTVGGGIGSVEDVAELPIETERGVVRLSDFADVHAEAEPAGSLSRVNGSPALTLTVIPASGANVVEISHGVQQQIEELAPGLHATFVTVFDQAPFIEQSVHDLSVEGGLGLVFAVLVILAFLWSWRSTIIAAVSIPLSLLITMAGLWWTDNTLNVLTLGALTIAIGRVVDDSIVVIENIARRRGDGPLTVEGIVASVRQVAGAITASTLTTVAVFLPIAFVSGTAGQLFRPFAVTTSIALLASLVVALTIVPVLAFWFMNRRGRRSGSPQPTGTTDHADHDQHDELEELRTSEDRLQRALMPALAATRRHSVWTVVGASLLLVATLMMSSLIRTDFLGSSGAASLELSQTVGTGADADQLVAEAEPVETALAEIDGVDDVLTTIPVASRIAGEPTRISYSLQLADGVEAAAVETAVERSLGELGDPDRFSLSTMDAAMSDGGGGIALQIRGADSAALQEASEQLTERLVDEPGVSGVESSITGEQPVVRVSLDEAKATKLGFDRTTVSAAIQQALAGTPIGTVALEGQDRDIVLRTAGADTTVTGLSDLLLPVTPQQNAEAQKRATDALEEQAEADAEQARLDQAAEFTRQLNDAGAQRAELAGQLDEMRQQLAALERTPVVPERPRTPNEEAAIRAQEERAEQIAGLREAIAAAESGIASADEQAKQVREAQAEAADQLVEQQETEAQQKAAGEARAKPITLGQVADVVEEKTAPSIERSGGERQVVLTVTPADGQLDQANAAVAAAIDEASLPSGVTFAVEGVSAEQSDAFAQLGAAMLAAIGLVLVIMVATFKSFRQPFVLLISIPFAATGALLALLLTNTPLGLPALIGLLMLIGIVVTNAIVLMDLINRLRSAGASLDEAIYHGTRLRLRPILMTAAATIFALLPMAFGLTGGGVFISQPLAVVVIGGLVSSTALTLILVPVLYGFVERRRERGRWRRARRVAKRSIRRAEQRAVAGRD